MTNPEFPLCDKDDPRVPVALDMLRKSQFMGGNFTLDARRILAALDRAVAPASEREHLLELIRDLADPDPCWYDHHGYCQAHGWMETEPRCPHARARELADGEQTGGAAEETPGSEMTQRETALMLARQIGTHRD